MPEDITSEPASAVNAAIWDSTWFPVGATPRTWEQRIAYALGSHDDYFDEQGIMLALFESQHGPCTMDTLLRLAQMYVDTYTDMQDQLHRGRFKEGETEDAFFERIGQYHAELDFTLRMLGVSPDDPYAERAREVLLRLFSSLDEPLVQVECALSLGRLREELLLPHLFGFLTGNYPFSFADFERPPQLTRLNYNSMIVYMYDNQWPEIPHLLWRWAPKQTVSALRRALNMLVQAERLAAYERDYYGPPYWRFENHIVYALGRLGAFGALAGIEPSEVFRKPVTHDESLPYVPRPEMIVDEEMQRVRAHIWRVHMCVAAVGYHYAHLGRLELFSQAPALQRQIEQLLVKHFGLSQEERDEALTAYEHGWLGEISEGRYREWQWENASATQ